jgi:uncharacterized protein (DUF1330 family)
MIQLFPAPLIDHQLDTLVKLDAQGLQHSRLYSSTLIFCRLVQAIPSTDQDKSVTVLARHPRKAARRLVVREKRRGGWWLREGYPVLKGLKGNPLLICIARALTLYYGKPFGPFSRVLAGFDLMAGFQWASGPKFAILRTRWPTCREENVMKTQYTVTLAMLAGVAVGALAVQGLHAQAKPPVYVVTEIDVKNIDAYVKEYTPLVIATIKNSGGKILAAGQRLTTLEGTPPKPRVAISVWDSLEKAQAWRNSAEYKKARTIGDKYAKYRSFAVEGWPQ